MINATKRLMKYLLYITLLIFSLSCVGTTIKPVPIANKLKITDQIELIFLTYNEEFNLYSDPRLIKNGVTSKIKGYDDDDQYTGIDSINIKISENKHYVKMDAIIKGYVEISDNERWLHENYQCVIIDIKKSKVVWSGVQKCDGEWKGNQWISHEQVEFNGK